MKLIKKLGALMLILSAFVVAFTFTSCSSSSGVEGSISAVTTATRATVTATFGTNKKLIDIFFYFWYNICVYYNIYILFC